MTAPAVGLEIHWSVEPDSWDGRRHAALRRLPDRGGEPFVVTSGDGLHDVDYQALVARHRAARAVATLTVAQVPDPSRYGVCVLDDEGMVIGFQEKPPAEEARSDLASCGVYAFDPAIFDRVPPDTFVDWARDVLPPALAEGDRLAAYRHDGYWNDVGTVGELLAGNLDAVTGRLDLDLGPRVAATASVASDVEVGEAVLIGEGAQVAPGVQLVEPVVIGPGAVVGRDAGLRECVVLPGARGPGSGPRRGRPGGRCGRARAELGRPGTMGHEDGTVRHGQLTTARAMLAACSRSSPPSSHPFAVRRAAFRARCGVTAAVSASS